MQNSHRYLMVDEAAAVAGFHPETVRDALRGGDLKGVQRVKKGKWRIREDWLTAWIENEPAELSKAA